MSVARIASPARGGASNLNDSMAKKEERLNKNKVLEHYLNEANAAYQFLENRLDEMLKKDLPQWVREAERNYKNWKRDFPDRKPPDIPTWQPKKQAAREKEIKAEIAGVKRIRDKFLRIMMRYQYNGDDIRMQTVADFYEYMVGKANVYGYSGWENMIYANELEQKAWEIKFDEIEKRFDKLLSNRHV